MYQCGMRPLLAKWWHNTLLSLQKSGCTLATAARHHNPWAITGLLLFVFYDLGQHRNKTQHKLLWISHLMPFSYVLSLICICLVSAHAVFHLCSYLRKFCIGNLPTMQVLLPVWTWAVAKKKVNWSELKLCQCNSWLMSTKHNRVLIENEFIHKSKEGPTPCHTTQPTETSLGEQQANAPGPCVRPWPSLGLDRVQQGSHRGLHVVEDGCVVDCGASRSTMSWAWSPMRCPWEAC